MFTRVSFACLLCALSALVSLCASAAQPDEPIDPDVLRKVRKLIKGTLEEDPKDREKAWIDIRDMGNLVTPGLVELCKLKETTPLMLKSIMIALGDSKDPRAGPALATLLKSPEVAVRRGAARAMGECKYTDGLAALDAAAQDEKEDDDVRLYAAVSGAKLGGTKGLAVLNAMLKSEKSEIRSRAVFALGKYGGIDQAGAIESALADTDDSVREDAVEALRLLKNKRAWSGLIKATADANFKIRGAAMDALRELTGQKFESDPKLWQDWFEKHKDDPDEKKDDSKDGKKDPKKKKDRLNEPF